MTDKQIQRRVDSVRDRISELASKLDDVRGSDFREVGRLNSTLLDSAIDALELAQNLLKEFDIDRYR